MDLIRGLSALAVMFGHIMGLFFVNYSFVTNRSLAKHGLYWVTSFGHEAVMVFFVLSGFFIGTSVLESFRERRWSWREYLINRLTRLQLVLVPALILGALWDQIGMRIPQATSLYFGEVDRYLLPSVALRSTVPMFFGNLFFLQGIASPVFGSNGPIWSLGYEWWYYILFPLLVIAAGYQVGRGMGSRFLHLGFAALLLYFVGSQIHLYFLIWLAGMFVGRLPAARGIGRPGIWTLLCVAAGTTFFLSLAWAHQHPGMISAVRDYVIGLCFSLWLYALIKQSREDVSRSYERVAKILAGFSYSLYLTHFPALLLTRALLNPNGNWQPDVPHLLYGLGIALIMLSYAYAVSLFTERQTAKVRRRLNGPASLAR